MKDPDEIGKKYLGKLEALIGEMGEEMLDANTRLKLETKIRNLFKENSIPFSLPHLKAFYQGMKLTMTALNREGDTNLVMTILMGVKVMISEKEKGIKSVVDKSINNGPEANQENSGATKPDKPISE